MENDSLATTSASDQFIAFPVVHAAHNSFDEKNFPPLPVRSDTQSALHSRVSSFQSLPGSKDRSSTPRVPPGFETTHGHPEPTKAQIIATEAPIQKATSTPVLPAVPTLPAIPRTSTPKPKTSNQSSVVKPKDTPEALDLGPEPQITKIAGDVSLGSPVPKARRTESQQVKNEKASLPEKPKQAQVTVSSSPSKVSDSKLKETKRAPKPGKIDIPARIPATTETPVKETGNKQPATPLTSGIVATPPLMSPKPVTPGTVASEVSRSSAPRPRTLRVTTSAAQKPATDPAPPSTTTETSTSTFPPPILNPSYPKPGAASRQMSISSAAKVDSQSQSQSRPSTPAMSEMLASEGASRASSPPPTLIGSAPERAKTKTQLKRERREKAKTQNQSIDSTKEPPAPSAIAPAAEEVGPIVARQKKQKKSKAQPSEPASERATRADEMRAATEAEHEDTKSDADDMSKVESRPETPIQEEYPIDDTPTADEPSYTLRDLYADAAKVKPEARDKYNMIRMMLQHKIPQSSIPRMLSSMIASEDLSKDHPWLNPGGYSFNSAGYKLPSDSRKGQEYLDAHGYVGGSYAFGHVYLPIKEKRALERGSAVGIASSPARSDKPEQNGNTKGKKGHNQFEQEDLLKRCLITPSGTVYRHLNAQEADKVLELEQRRQWYVEEFGEDVGGMHALEKPLEVDDYINLSGGMEELGRYGERHGIVWVNGADDGGNDEEFEDQEDIEDMDEDAGLMSDETDDLGIDLDPAAGMLGAWEGAQPGLPGVHATGGRPPNTLAPMKNQPAVLAPNINLRALDVESLQKRVGEKQKELEAAKKEMERMDKSMGKRNKEFGKWRDAVLKA